MRRWAVLFGLVACGRDAAPPRAAEPEPLAPPPELAAPGPRAPTITSHTGAHRWSLRAGGVGDDAARAIAIDGEGGVAVTGFFSGAVDFGDGKVLTARKRDVFVARYDAAGTLRWVKQVGGPDDDEGNAIAIAADGDLLVTGSFSGEVSFGGDDLLAAGDDVFLVRYAPDGAHRWSRRFGGEGADAGAGLALDARGAIALTGSMSDHVDFGGGMVTSTGLDDAFVAVFGPDGAHRWSRRDGDTEADFGRGVAFDGRGDLYWIGDFARRIAIGDDRHDSAGNRDILLVKYAAGGRPLWSRRFGNHFHDLGVAVATDRDGDVVFTGSFQLPVELGGAKLIGAGDADLFVARYSPAGEPRWARRVGGPREDIGSGLAVDVDGNAIVTGWFWDRVDCAGHELASAGQTDVLVAVFAPDGAPRWCRGLGGAGADFGKAVAVDSGGGIAVAGTFRATIDLGGGPLVAPAEPDARIATGEAFVARFEP